MSLIDNNSSGTTDVSVNYKHKQLILYFLCTLVNNTLRFPFCTWSELRIISINMISMILTKAIHTEFEIFCMYPAWAFNFNEKINDKCRT